MQLDWTVDYVNRMALNTQNSPAFVTECWDKGKRHHLQEHSILNDLKW